MAKPKWDASGQAELESFISGLGLPDRAPGGGGGGGVDKHKRKRASASASSNGVTQANGAGDKAKAKGKQGKGKGKEPMAGPKEQRQKAPPGSNDAPKVARDPAEPFLRATKSKAKGGGGGGPGSADKGAEGAETKTHKLNVLRKKLHVQPSSGWYGEDGTAMRLPKGAEPDLDALPALQEEAAQLLADDAAVAEEMHLIEYASEDAWMKTILRDGTLGDKLAAWMLRVQESPVHRLKALDALLGYTAKRKREALEAIDTMRELWLINLLPDRKLLRWVERPLSELPPAGRRRSQLLVLWHYEAEIKTRYGNFVDVLERMCHDQLPEVKIKVLGTVFELLAGKPELEKRLLGIVCNKLGDPHPKVAGKAQYYLKQLVSRHPRMKTVVTKEVHHVISRPNLAPSAQYTAITLLNQLELSRRDEDVALAKRLIDIYFQFFDAATKDGELGSKLLSALLTGVNRAHPFAGIGAAFFDKYSPVLFRMVHVGSFNCAVQALLLLCQVLEGSQAVSDRYFRAVYAKLLDPELVASSKQGMFLNVLFRTMRMDPSAARVKAFAKRLLQVCSSGGSAGFACGSLFMLAKVAQLKPSIAAMVNQPEDVDGGEEHIRDAPESGGSDADSDAAAAADGAAEGGGSSSGSGGSRNGGPHADADVAAEGYDPRKREPLYCRAEQTCLWELLPLLRHHHPSVATFAAAVRDGRLVAYDGDPLRDFALPRFLDKFVYKKPKAERDSRVGSAMQPKRSAASAFSADQVVNSPGFLRKDPSKIPAHERFFHQYFAQRAAKSRVSAEEPAAEAAAAPREGKLANFAGDVAPDAFDDVDDDDDEAMSADDDDDDVYAALAEGDFDDELGDDELGDFGDFSDDDDDDAEIDADGRDDDDEEEEDSGGKAGGRGGGRGRAGGAAAGVKLGGSVFASAEEFSHLLEEDTEAADTQAKWEGSRSVKPGAQRRRPSKRARMTKRA